MYKRPGFIIDRFGFYIFQPSGLEDVDIPCSTDICLIIINFKA